MKKARLALSMTLALCMALSSAFSADAAKSINELKQEMDARSKTIKQKQAEIKSKEAQKDAQVAKRMELDTQISGLEEDIDDVESVIREKDAEIQEKNNRIEELQQVIDKNKDTLKQRVRIMYEYGNSSYLEVLLQANGFGDLLTRISVLQDIVSHDNKIIDDYIASQTELEAAKQTIVTEREEQVSAKSILESKKSELKTLQSEKQQIIDSLNADINALEKEEKAAEAEYNSIMSQVKKAQQELQKKQSSSSSSASSGAVKKGTGQFLWPAAAGGRITSGYGRREKPNAAATSIHRGIDIGVASGTNVLAADGGTVIVAGSGRSYGNYVVIDHGNGYTTLYAHNSRLCVSVGESVSRGQVIAKAGSTGNSTGPHIHFEVSYNGSLVNPMNFF